VSQRGRVPKPYRKAQALCKNAQTLHGNGFQSEMTVKIKVNKCKNCPFCVWELDGWYCQRDPDIKGHRGDSGPGSASGPLPTDCPLKINSYWIEAEEGYK
jgi:hypothetical protein